MFKRPSACSGPSGPRRPGAPSAYAVLQRKLKTEQALRKRVEKQRKKLEKDLAKERAQRQQSDAALDCERESRQDLVAAAVQQRCAFLRAPDSFGVVTSS